MKCGVICPPHYKHRLKNIPLPVQDFENKGRKNIKVIMVSEASISDCCFFLFRKNMSYKQEKNTFSGIRI